MYFRDITDRKDAEEAARGPDRAVSKTGGRKPPALRRASRERQTKGRIPGDACPRAAQSAAAVGNAVTVLKMSSGPEHVEFAKDVIERQVGQLVRLIDDLLDVARITSGKIHLKKEYVWTPPSSSSRPLNRFAR